MKRYIVLFLAFMTAHGIDTSTDRCAQCEKKKQEKKDAQLQAAAINLATIVTNSAFAMAANPDDKNCKIQAGNAVALGFIGLIAAAMKSKPIDLYDADGNQVLPVTLAQILSSQIIEDDLLGELGSALRTQYPNLVEPKTDW